LEDFAIGKTSWRFLLKIEKKCSYKTGYHGETVIFIFEVEDLA
jgi:hypothetical protein